MGAAKGNKNTEKFKTDAQKKELLEAICKHLEEGLSQDCFSMCDWDTVERYAKEYPLVFPAKKIRESKKKGQEMWEKVGKRQALTGKGSASAWIFTMKNKYSWKDRRDITTNDKDLPSPILNVLSNNSDKESGGAE